MSLLTIVILSVIFYLLGWAITKAILLAYKRHAVCHNDFLHAMCLSDGIAEFMWPLFFLGGAIVYFLYKLVTNIVSSIAELIVRVAVAKELDTKEK